MTFVNKLVQACRAEQAFFENGKWTEGNERVYRRVGEYWLSIKVQGIDGRTQVRSSRTGTPYNPAWSAAFVSFVCQQAGAGKRFPSSQAHCHYIEHFRSPPDPARSIYRAVDPNSVAPTVGDIVCSGREYAQALTFAQAALTYRADSFYPAHGDVVVEVDRALGRVIVIGGNVDSSVKEKVLAVGPNGRLLPRASSNKSLPWLALLKCQAK
jgi:hypothetical protein